MGKGKWIRWIGAAAAAVVLSLAVMHREFFTGCRPDNSDILLYLGLTVLPCFVTIFLIAFARFWWSFAFGLWIAFMALSVCLDEKASPASVLFLLSAVIVCCTPFLNLIYRAK